MKYILGKKIEMTQRFGDQGKFIPVTIVQAGPCVVTQVKKKEKDGYSAVQVGFGSKKHITKPMAGHLKGLGQFRYVKEYRTRESSENLPERGATIDVSAFKAGEIVQVTGTSKGRGFAGVVKRHHFHGHPATRGTKDQVRMPGSIGSTGPQHVSKGTSMAGRMGTDRVTLRNLEVIDVDLEKNLLLIKGAVPGARNSLVIIQGK